MIFTKAYYQQGQERVENGTLGIVKEVRGEHSVSVDTLGAKQREVGIDTQEFKDLRLGYAQHVYKAQGLTANKALALIGGWQTDRERAYVALTRGREETNIYTSKNSLGNHGMDPEAIERLAVKMAQSNAQQASISQERATCGSPAHDPEARSAATRDPTRETPGPHQSTEQRTPPSSPVNPEPEQTPDRSIAIEID